MIIDTQILRKIYRASVQEVINKFPKLESKYEQAIKEFDKLLTEVEELAKPYEEYLK